MRKFICLICFPVLASAAGAATMETVAFNPVPSGNYDRLYISQGVNVTGALSIHRLESPGSITLTGPAGGSSSVGLLTITQQSSDVHTDIGKAPLTAGSDLDVKTPGDVGTPSPSLTVSDVYDVMPDGLHVGFGGTFNVAGIMNLITGAGPSLAFENQPGLSLSAAANKIVAWRVHDTSMTVNGRAAYTGAQLLPPVPSGETMRWLQIKGTETGGSGDRIWTVLASSPAAKAAAACGGLTGAVNLPLAKGCCLNPADNSANCRGNASYSGTSSGTSNFYEAALGQAIPGMSYNYGSMVADTTYDAQ